MNTVDNNTKELLIEVTAQRDWFKKHLDDIRREGGDTNYAAGSLDAYAWVLGTWDEITRIDYDE